MLRLELCCRVSLRGRGSEWGSATWKINQYKHIFPNFFFLTFKGSEFLPTLATKLSSILLPPVGTLSARDEEGVV